MIQNYNFLLQAYHYHHSSKIILVELILDILIQLHMIKKQENYILELSHLLKQSMVIELIYMMELAAIHYLLKTYHRGQKIRFQS